MIKSITIKNIQSHKDSVLNFSDGINTIIGSSNNGKSAILRALYWVLYNRPLGTDVLASHWCVNDKGLTDDMEVIIRNKDNVVCRRRNKNDNQYIVDEMVLNVVKSDVPDEVKRLLKLSDTNVQKQLDEPFLLSNSSGEVARYFNNIVRLDMIDKVLSNAESKKRKNKSDIENLSDLIKNQELKLNEFEWMEEADRLISKIETLQSKLDKINQDKSLLTNELINLKKFQKNKQNNFEHEVKLLSKIEELNQQINNLKKESLSLKESISEFKNVKVFPDFSKEKKKIETINDLKKSDIPQEVINLVHDLEMISNLSKLINSNSKKINDLKSDLPETCPICGGKL